MLKSNLWLHIMVLFLLASGLEASYPVRGIEDVVRGFECGTIDLEESSHASARQVMIKFEKKLSEAREHRTLGSLEKPWTTKALQNMIRRESLITIEHLNNIDLKYAKDVQKMYIYFSNCLNAMRVKHEKVGRETNIQTFDKAMRELQMHPRLKYAESIIDEQKKNQESRKLRDQPARNN